MEIHKTSIIDKTASIGDDVTIGPFCVIEEGVILGHKSKLDAYVHIKKNTRIGNNCSIFSGAVLGGDPQITDFKNNNSYVQIGNANVIREFVTIHRSGKEGHATSVGNNCFFMAYSHIAHDCIIENDVIITNYTGVPGHVTIGDKAVISGYVGIHQFVRIGKLTMISGLSRLSKDVPPFFLIEGNPARVVGINVVGLRRAGVSSKTRSDLTNAFKFLSHSGLNTKQAIKKIKDELNQGEEINYLVNFIESSERGICK